MSLATQELWFPHLSANKITTLTLVITNEQDFRTSLHYRRDP
jgi:hypothetical protein